MFLWCRVFQQRPVIFHLRSQLDKALHPTPPPLLHNNHDSLQHPQTVRAHACYFCLCHHFRLFMSVPPILILNKIFSSSRSPLLSRAGACQPTSHCSRCWWRLCLYREPSGVPEEPASVPTNETDHPTEPSPLTSPAATAWQRQPTAAAGTTLAHTTTKVLPGIHVLSVSKTEQKDVFIRTTVHLF